MSEEDFTDAIYGIVHPIGIQNLDFQISIGLPHVKLSCAASFSTAWSAPSKIELD